MIALLAGRAAAAQTPDPPAWEWSASVYAYLVPDEADYLQPTLAADRGALHLEARYNYEALEAGSAWVGYNFSTGETLELAFTPMLGGVFGSTTGIAPGYEGSLSWKALELYSEGEYVFDLGDSADSYFYNWSQLIVTPVHWLHAGLVTQRTRAYQSDRDLQRGPFLGVTYKSADITAFVLNPDDTDPTVVVALEVSF